MVMVCQAMGATVDSEDEGYRGPSGAVAELVKRNPEWEVTPGGHSIHIEVDASEYRRFMSENKAARHARQAERAKRRAETDALMEMMGK
jgi:hypothetical protein